MSDVLPELLQAFRRWRARPAFAVTALVTLTLGIGVTTSIFSVVDGVLLRPLPWREPARLAVPWIVRPEWRHNPVLAASAGRGVLSWPNFRELQSQNRTLESVAIWTTGRPLIDAGGAVEPASVMRVSSTFLDTLGVKPATGRNFSAGEDDDPSDAVIVSHEAWRRRFGGDAAILGRKVTLDENRPHDRRRAAAPVPLRERSA